VCTESQKRVLRGPRGLILLVMQCLHSPTGSTGGCIDVCSDAAAVTAACGVHVPLCHQRCKHVGTPLATLAAAAFHFGVALCGGSTPDRLLQSCCPRPAGVAMLPLPSPVVAAGGAVNAGDRPQGRGQVGGHAEAARALGSPAHGCDGR